MPNQFGNRQVTANSYNHERLQITVLYWLVAPCVILEFLYLVTHIVSLQNTEMSRDKAFAVFISLPFLQVLITILFVRLLMNLIITSLWLALVKYSNNILSALQNAGTKSLLHRSFHKWHLESFGNNLFITARVPFLLDCIVYRNGFSGYYAH